ncbi:MAG TPA: ATP-binding protein [Nitrospiria bacterium]|nr:ATP-binding protein [Nitrospiria bacterium]
MIQELLPEQLRRTFGHEVSCIDTTENLKSLDGIIGQKRAVSALLFGLEIRETGFNIYVAGPPGMGKMTAVKSFLEELAGRKEVPPDWCYVNDFDDSYKPRIVKLPAGRGRKIQQDMKNLIDHIQREIPKAFESEEYGARRDEIAKAMEKKRTDVIERLNMKANEAGFTIEATPFGILMVPVLGGRSLTDAEFAALSASAREDLQRKRELLQDELNASLKQVRDLERGANEKLEALDRQATLYIVGGLIDDLEEKYRDLPEIVAYLKAVQKDILENIKIFKSGQSGTAAQALEGLSLPAPWLQEMPFRRYQVNVIVDNSRLGGAPVVVELNPSYNNLFGRIEKETQLGALYTDFTMIKAGSLHRANGGFLVVPVEDVLRNLLSWDGLKRALRSREIQIEEPGERLGFLTTKSLRPEPVGFDIKVVLIGHPMLYYLLHAYDEEFPELFKVKADFDTHMDCTDENIQDFVAFLSTFCRKENLKPLDGSAVARLLEHAARLAEDQEKLSTHFGALVDVVREAHFWAHQEGAARVGAAHMQKSLDQKIYRSNLIQERINEMIARGTILIDVAGQAVGQVNGLSVISLGDYVFGKPSRITASVEPGQGGIVDIEREVELGGPIHSKGILILGGYLAQKYAQERPLTLAARLVFEQSYDGVEGDSASSTELYALLSALSGLPVKQGIAVTGSVNQHGQVQAIGGVNQKIEGFFDVCKAKGMTGEQGVIIPQNNVKNLMLREDVVDAVRSKKFHIWAAKTIDEGIEILTGVPNGDRRRDGTFPDGTLSYIVEKRLQGFAESMKELPKDEKPPRARKKAKKK